MTAERLEARRQDRPGARQKVVELLGIERGQRQGRVRQAAPDDGQLASLGQRAASSVLER
jgi:uncharacterized protein (DUF2342 family)